MATAAGIVIAEVQELYDIGDLDPNEIDTPGIFVDMVVEAS
jgi:acyl CoA:acetate/3-ketoacid CoA transferase alpha subunit